MKFIRNYFCRLMADFYMDMRDLYNSSLFYNPIKSIHCDLKKQKWESKIK